MTELSFLIDLLLDHKLPRLTRDVVKARIKEVEARPCTPTDPRVQFASSQLSPVTTAPQAPSTLAAMARNGFIETKIASEPGPPVVVAHTPQAAAALASREQTIQRALSGVPEPGAKSPRKF